MYDFDQVIDRNGTTSIKWNKQYSFGVKNGLLPFWIADTDFATLPEITQAIQNRCQHPIIGYSEPQEGCYKAIANWWERRHDWKPEISCMLLSYGVVTGIRFTINVVLQPNDKVMIFTPVYDPFFEVTGNSGHTLVDCPLVHENHTYRIDFELMEKQLKEGTKAVLISNPHNPLGRVWTFEEMKRIVELCVKYDVYLLSDEIHADIGLFGNKYVTAGRFPEIYDKLIIYTAIGKTFNMAGLGSSCMFIPNPELKKRIAKAYDDCWLFGPCDLAFTAIEAAYTYGDKWVDEECEYLSKNAVFVKEFCEKNMPKIDVTKLEGTFLMWLDMRCLGLSSDQITSILAKEYKIALGNGGHYGKQADGFMRFNIGCPHTTLEQGLEILKKFYLDYIK